MYDYFRVPLAGFFILALLLSLVAPLCLFWGPVAALWVVYLYGPIVAVVMWMVAIALAVRVHGRRGWWLMLTSIAMLPGAYLHFALVWGCILFGACL